MEGIATDIGWIVVAFVAGLGARKLKLPPLVGYLVAGMTLAVFGVEDSPTLQRVGDLGVALLLFMVGLDLRWKNLTRAEVLGAGTVHLVIFSGVALLGGRLLGLSWVGSALVAISLSVSSLVLAAKALEVQRSLRAYHGRVAIGIILFQTVVATTALIPVGPAPSPWALAIIGLVLARPLVRMLLSAIESDELMLFFGLALAAAGYMLFSETGLGGELGALAAGALLAGHDRTDSLADTLNPVKDTFLAAFFLSIGLVGLPSMAGLALVTGLTLLLVLKSALYFGVLVGFHLTARTAFMTALPLTTYSGFTLIMGSATVRAGLLPESALTALALATVASYLINAPLGRYAADLWRAVHRQLAWLERSGKHPDAQPQTLGHTQYLVVGMERIGTAAYDHLKSLHKCTTGIDDDPRRIADHRRAGRRILYGDARNRSLWEELDFGPLEAVILTLSDQEAKLDAIRALRGAGFEGGISAFTAEPSDREALMKAGANAVYLSVEQAGQALAAYSLTRGADPVPGGITLDVAAEGEQADA